MSTLKQRQCRRAMGAFVHYINTSAATCPGLSPEQKKARLDLFAKRAADAAEAGDWCRAQRIIEVAKRGLPEAEKPSPKVEMPTHSPEREHDIKPDIAVSLQVTRGQPPPSAETAEALQ